MDNQVHRRMIERHRARCRSYLEDGWQEFISPGCFRDSCFTAFRLPGKAKRLSVFTTDRVQRIRVNGRLVSETWFSVRGTDAQALSANSPT